MSNKVIDSWSLSTKAAESLALVLFALTLAGTVATLLLTLFLAFFNSTDQLLLENRKRRRIRQRSQILASARTNINDTLSRNPGTVQTLEQNQNQPQQQPQPQQQTDPIPQLNRQDSKQTDDHEMTCLHLFVLHNQPISHMDQILSEHCNNDKITKQRNFKVREDYETDENEYGLLINAPVRMLKLTPLHVAALHGSPEQILRLVEFGANINAVDSAGRTALWHGSVYICVFFVHRFIYFPVCYSVVFCIFKKVVNILLLFIKI